MDLKMFANYNFLKIKIPQRSLLSNTLCLPMEPSFLFMSFKHTKLCLPHRARSSLLCDTLSKLSGDIALVWLYVWDSNLGMNFPEPLVCVSTHQLRVYVSHLSRGSPSRRPEIPLALVSMYFICIVDIVFHL